MVIVDTVIHIEEVLLVHMMRLMIGGDMVATMDPTIDMVNLVEIIAVLRRPKGNAQVLERTW